MDIAVLDYGAGNIASVVKAFAHLGAAPRVAFRGFELDRAPAIVIPGVGHFDRTASIDHVTRRAVRDAVARGVPLLGICVGLQWLFEGSDEAPAIDGLGVFPGRCFRLERSAGLKVPHVGWNTVDRTGRPSRLLDGLGDASVYFTHSFAAPVVADTTASTFHGRAFSSIVERDAVFAVQFHPEKSGAAGLRLLASFLDVVREAA